MNRECRAAMTRKSYCGNLLWQSGPVGSVAGEMVVVSVPAIIPTIEGIMEALSAKLIPIPAM